MCANEFCLYWVAQKRVHFLITWVPVNQFQRSIPCFEGHLTAFKMRYKAMYNYSPIKFYELNHYAAILILQGGAKKFFFVFHKFMSFFSFSGPPFFNHVSKTAIFSQSCGILWKTKKFFLHHPVVSILQHKWLNS